MKISEVIETMFNLKNIERVITDSRTAGKNDIFIPLKGENFDGHDFIESSLTKNISAYLYSDKDFKGKRGIFVPDTLSAYREIAREYRKKINCLTLAITGTTGKSTTRKLLQDIFDSAGKRVHCTKENENNTIGVPKTILSMPEDTECLIIEFGTNKKGEIAIETDTALPNSGIFLNIGPSHLEFLGDMQGVFLEKAYMTDQVMKVNGPIFIPDDIVFKHYSKYERTNFISYSVKDNILIVFNNGKEFTEIPVNEKLCIYANNIAFSTVVARNYGIQWSVIIDSIKNFIPDRMKEFIWKGKKVIDDSYNANPVSFKAALRYFFSMKGKKAIVIGKMLELGRDEIKYHKEIFDMIISEGVELVIAKGDLPLYIPSNWVIIDSEADIIDHLEKNIGLFDSILLKGSHGTEVYKVSKIMKGE